MMASLETVRQTRDKFMQTLPDLWLGALVAPDFRLSLKPPASGEGTSPPSGQKSERSVTTEYETRRRGRFTLVPLSGLSNSVGFVHLQGSIRFNGGGLILS